MLKEPFQHIGLYDKKIIFWYTLLKPATAYTENFFIQNFRNNVGSCFFFKFHKNVESCLDVKFMMPNNYTESYYPAPKTLNLWPYRVRGQKYFNIAPVLQDE